MINFIHVGEKGGALFKKERENKNYFLFEIKWKDYVWVRSPLSAQLFLFHQ